ncbi:MAG TPA: hypothetical protein VFJ14_11350 [Nocardioidaceae bacterium]|nr:hypothetical protein [Nocardioidaceae bacterium]
MTADHPTPTDAEALPLVPVCWPCIRGEGSECHTPGCALWLRDVPPDGLQQALVTDLAERDRRVREAARAEAVAPVLALREQWEAALDDGCPSCGPVGFTGCDHIEGYHHALSDLRAAVEDSGALARIRAEAETTHRDLTSRLGFGDNITERQADNDTIVAWFEEQSRDAKEWQESQLWRDDCYLAGHPEDEDCPEHDPILLAEQRGAARVKAAVESLIDQWPVGDNGQDYRRAVTQCAQAVRAALADSDTTAHDRAAAAEFDRQRGYDHLSREERSKRAYELSEGAPAIYRRDRTAEAWDKGYTSGHSNAMRRMSDEPHAPTTPNPYRAAAVRQDGER